MQTSPIDMTPIQMAHEDEPLGSFERDDLVADYLEDCRTRIIDEIQSFIPRRTRFRSCLYDLMLDYPLRAAKALRPALCIATCRALGGSLEAVLRSAAVLEFYHNAFLIHDDIEDGSEKRRDAATLHRAHGVPVAINVGDAMLAVALEPLLDNVRLVGLGKALRILQVIARMARESAEGQALELSWIQQRTWSLDARDYLRMVHQKTSWYTFITPLLVGGIVAGADDPFLRSARRFGTALGLAFQIQDDVLNLVAEEAAYGKEIRGDLWEGKHTLILIHALRSSTAAERERAVDVLCKARPGERAAESAVGFKAEGDIDYLSSLVTRYDSIGYAKSVAQRRAERALHSFERLERSLRPSTHLDFLKQVTRFVIERDH